MRRIFQQKGRDCWNAFPLLQKANRTPNSNEQDSYSKTKSISTVNMGEVLEYGRKRVCLLWHHMKYLLPHWGRKTSKGSRTDWRSLFWGKTLGLSGGAVGVIRKLGHWNIETGSFLPINSILRGKLRLFKIKNQRCLAGSVRGEGDSWSWGCDSKPQFGYRDYVKLIN